MTAPALPATRALDALRDQVIFTNLALDLEARAKHLAAPFGALIAQHPALLLGQHACWDAQTLAGLKVRRADRRLDAHVERFIADLVHHYGDRGAEGVQHYLRGRTVSAIKRTVLGPEVAIVAEWITSIGAEKSKALRAWGPVFTADLADAEAATREAATADAANRQFRERGPLAAFVSALDAARDTLHNKLEALRLASTDDELTPDWPDSFFAPSKRAPANEAERAAKAEARAAKRLERERKTAARAEALKKLHEAQAALKALQKK